MKRIILLVIIGMAAYSAAAQKDLTGRVYSNPNIMDKVMSQTMKDIDQKMDSVKTAAYAEKEKEKGRKMTADEKAKVDEDVKKALEMMTAFQKGMKTAVSIEFKSDKEVVQRMKISIDEEVLKAAGIGWAKRKAMKAALALAPSSEKGTYRQSGDLIIISDKEDSDTLRISNDGKHLYGHMDEMSFTLTRTK